MRVGAGLTRLSWGDAEVTLLVGEEIVSKLSRDGLLPQKSAVRSTHWTKLAPSKIAKLITEYIFTESNRRPDVGDYG